jgi:hypothetical protein
VHTFAEGRKVKQAEEYKDGYEAGYQDCETQYKGSQEHWEELEWLLGVSFKPGNESRPTIADVATQTNPLPPPQQPPAIVDTSLSPSMTENVPRMSMTTSLSPTNPELKNHVAFRADTPPAPLFTESKPLSPIPNTLSTSHSPPQLENAMDTSVTTSQSSMIPENKTGAGSIVTTSTPPSLPVNHQENSVQTVSAVNYEIPASPKVLKSACTHASVAASDMPLGAIWNSAVKLGYDEGSSMVDSILVTDLLKTGFEKGNIYGIMVERDYHSRTCPGLIPCSICEAGIQVIETNPLNSPEAIDILCAFSSTAPSTTPFGLIWECAFQAGTKVTQVQAPHHINISTQTSVLSPPPPQNMTLDWSEI